MPATIPGLDRHFANYVIVLGFSRETEPIYVIYYKESAYATMEAEKPHDLLSEVGRPSGGVLTSVQEDTEAPAQTVRGAVNSSFLYPFVLFRPSRDWMQPTHAGEGNLLYSVSQFRCSSRLETPSQTPPELIFNPMSGYRVAWSS